MCSNPPCSTVVCVTREPFHLNIQYHKLAPYWVILIGSSQTKYITCIFILDAFLKVISTPDTLFNVGPTLDRYCDTNVGLSGLGDIEPISQGMNNMCSLFIFLYKIIKYQVNILTNGVPEMYPTLRSCRLDLYL